MEPFRDITSEVGCVHSAVRVIHVLYCVCE